MDTRATTFGKLLREKRNARGLTQRELAELAHVDDSYISQLERDYKSPSARTLEGLARALDVNVAALLAKYFPPVEPRPPQFFAGRAAEAAAFAAAVDERAGLFFVAGPAGAGKTALVNEKLIPLCRERRLNHVYFDCRRVTSYREFLKNLRDAFPARAGYHGFDEVLEQCRAIERRLRSRFQDPFSLQVTAAGEAAEGTELSFAEKYIYRDAERLLTDELLAAWTKSFGKSAAQAVMFLDDVDALGATAAYWLGRFWERAAEAGILGERLTVVMTARAPARLPLPLELARRVRRVVLAPFTFAEAEEYVRGRGLALSDAEREFIRALGGDVRALSFWADYFEAAVSYRDNRLGRAEEALLRLDEEITPYIAEGELREGALLRMKTQRMLGHLTRLQGRLEEAAAYYGAAVALAECFAGAPSGEVGYLYLDLGHVRRHRGLWDAAIDFYVRAEGVFAARGDDLGAGIAHSSLGTAFRLKGKFARAKQEYRRAAEFLAPLAEDGARGPEARRWLASTLSNEAITARLEAERAAAAGEKAVARKAIARAKQLCREALAGADDAAEAAVAENRYALCLLTESKWLREAGRDAEAAEMLADAVLQHKRALATFENLGDKYRVAQVLADLGVAAAAQGFIHDAIINFKNALALFQQMGSRYHGAKVLVELGLLSEGDEQLSYFAEALASAREHNAESLAEIAGAIKNALAEANGGRAKRFFDEQAALDPRLGELFAAA